MAKGKKNKDEDKSARGERKSPARETIECLVSAFILALIVLTFIARAFKIPSRSMYPTLQVGDKIFVNRFSYRSSSPERGDIAVFVYPEDKKRDFVKRVVGLPGETVQINDGNIFIDGRKIKGTSFLATNRYFNVKVPFGYGKIKVPENAYFVLGDNSENSRDSRYWGFVPQENLKGKAFLIYWPPQRIKLLH